MVTGQATIIRQRGQVTIPDAIRENFTWLTPGSVIFIKPQVPDELIIRAYESQKKEVDWDKIWKYIKKSRNIRGKGNISGSEFIAHDRQTHF